MRRRIAVLALAAALAAGCSSDVDSDPIANSPGRCKQERTEKFLGFIQTSRSSFITNC